ncbi:unnamed protein product [Blepharisma stoltei]|uniref:Uncharacterized protein n=1 Tax=Blepharisma stoltei TaxID=1481888 RepID=A0AAU9IPQ4_9CILI|nr:unnamed protein product [Blepharisma stoltei]
MESIAVIGVSCLFPSLKFTIGTKRKIVFLFTILFAILLLSLYFFQRAPTYYDLLKVKRDISYYQAKDLSRKATEETREMWKIISDPLLRLDYELYGTDTEVASHIHLESSIMFYLSWIITINILSFNTKSGNVWTRLVIPLAIIGAFEFDLKLRKTVRFPLEILPLTLLEQVKLLQTLYAAYALFAILNSQVNDQAKDKEDEEKWKALKESNKELKQISEKINGESMEEIKEYLAAIVLPRNLEQNQQESPLMKIGKKIGMMILVYIIINKIG